MATKRNPKCKQCHERPIDLNNELCAQAFCGPCAVLRIRNIMKSLQVAAALGIITPEGRRILRGLEKAFKSLEG